MKKLFLTVWIVSIIMALMLSVNAADTQRVSVQIDGVTQNYKTEPVIVNGRTLASTEDIFNSLNIEYKEDEKTVTAETGDYNVTLTIGSEKAVSARLNFTLDVCPQIINGKEMLPLRFIAEQLGFKVDWIDESKTVVIEKLELFREETKSEAKKAVIARARQLTEFKFTPLKDIPTATSKTDKSSVFEAGKEYAGFPYSSTEYNDKFFSENVSFETFLSALSNPDSVLYKKDLYFTGIASTYYGIVCNGLVRHSLGIKQRYNTQHWLTVPGMDVVYQAGEYTVEDLELCDILHVYGSGSSHTAIITGILRDKNNKVVQVEVSEAVRPTCRRRLFTEEDFNNRFGIKYKVCRYRYIDSVPPLDEEENDLLFNSGIEKQTPLIAVDYGNKSNYREGERINISVFAEGKNVIQIIQDGNIIEEIESEGYKKFRRNFQRGYYVVKLKDTDHYTEFYVSSPEVSHTVENNIITVTASSMDSESVISHMDFRLDGDEYAGLCQVVPLSDEEKQSGIIIRDIPKDAVTFRIYFKNKYGIWTHKIIKI